MKISNTYQEIHSQYHHLEETLRVMLKLNVSDTEKDVDVYLFTGCGTSYYLAISAARFFQSVTGKTAFFVPASEIIMTPDQVFTSNINYKIVAISRSGTTTEIVHALKFIKEKNLGSTLAITCYAGSEMTKLVDENIVLDHINEKSVVMTQSFTNMLFALQIYAAKVAKDSDLLEELEKIPDQALKILEKSQLLSDVAKNLDFKRFIFLGTGINYGLACEATLKLKEMTQTQCEAYSCLEFRHGPISVVDQCTVVVLFSIGTLADYEQPVLQDVKKFGGYTLAVGNIQEEKFADKVINMDTDLSDLANTVLYILPAQILALDRTVALELNPDEPRNLNQVVKVVLPGIGG